ncbi:MAG: PepSY-associated TM helix domain-containing protein [Pseudomonadota bacterium]
MSFLPQSGSKRLLSIHGWSGVLLGLLLYVCIFTGAIVVFEREINIWSQGQLAQSEGLGTRVDHYFRVNARDVDPRYYEEVSIFRTAGGNFNYRFHTHETDPDTGRIVEPTVRLTVDGETGEVIDRFEGLPGDQGPNPGTALRNFWVDLHVQLYVPAPWGLYLTGILGLAMMAAAVSGILLHKHMIRDAFVSARSSMRLVGARDLHVLAGTWGLPFAILLAFTGAFFSLAGTVGVPAMAWVAFNGDQEEMIETIIGLPEDLSTTPASMASLDYIIKDAHERTGGAVQSIQIMNYNTERARVMVRLSPAEGNLTGTTLGFDGPTRAFLGEQPAFGQDPSMGASLLSLIAPLHFGNFAGVLSKTVWLGLGLASAWVAATGMLLWTKRRQDEPLWQRFRHTIVGVIWGLPIAMLVSAVAYFFTLPAGDPHFWTPMGFLAGALGVVALAWDRDRAQDKLSLALALLCIAMPLLRLVTGGASWSEALIAGAAEILIIDLLLVVGGLVLLRWSRRRAPATEPLTPNAYQEPAE